MSNRKKGDAFPRCPSCNGEGVCMYIGPCLVCVCNRAQYKPNIDPAWSPYPEPPEGVNESVAALAKDNCVP